MFLKLEVKTFCTVCNTERKGKLFGYKISSILFLCTILFEECGHKRSAILSLQEIKKIEEVINVQTS